MSDILFILLPGAIYFWVLFLVQGPMQEVLEEAENKVLPRLLAGPVTRGQYVLSKMLRCFLLSTLAVVLLLGSSSVLFGIQWGHPLKVAVVVAAWAASMTGLMAVLYSVTRTREQAGVFSPVVLVVFAMLGGSMFPYENLPDFLQALGQFTPNRWAVLTLQGVARSKPLGELAGPFLGLLAVAGLGTLLAFVLFNRRLAAGCHP
jgi:ABC-2 type transport system permease protein